MKSTAEAVLFVCRNKGIYSAIGTQGSEIYVRFRSAEKRNIRALSEHRTV